MLTEENSMGSQSDLIESLHPQTADQLKEVSKYCSIAASSFTVKTGLGT